ncbi:MAG: hypothetical protein CTY30_09985 [Methylocystis sp.]|nr:MAG: hypothetical protein CTY30_09985 [Methylocystis sp.]
MTRKGAPRKAAATSTAAGANAAPPHPSVPEKDMALSVLVCLRRAPRVDAADEALEGRGN